MPCYDGRDDTGSLYREIGELKEMLCEAMQLHADTPPSQFSSGLQAWWMDHRRRDQERICREMAERKTQADRDAALAKLTPYERSLFGM